MKGGFALSKDNEQERAKSLKHRDKESESIPLRPKHWLLGLLTAGKEGYPRNQLSQGGQYFSLFLLSLSFLFFFLLFELVFNV